MLQKLAKVFKNVTVSREQDDEPSGLYKMKGICWLAK